MPRTRAETMYWSALVRLSKALSSLSLRSDSRVTALGWGLGGKLRRVVDSGRQRETAGDGGRRRKFTATCESSVYIRAGDTRSSRK